MTLRISISLLLVVCFSAAAHAQVGRDVAERGSNRAQISKGQAQLESGSKALTSFSSQLDALRAATAAKDSPEANRTLDELRGIMGGQLEQGAARAEAMKRELAGSVSETGSNRRESRRNRDDSDAFGRSDDDEADAIRDGVNRVDDARDVADDKKDLAELGERLKQQQQIAQSLASVQLALDSPTGGEDANRTISELERFEGLMQQDLKAIEAEITEDRREAGEDRRETRDDLREADEPDNRHRRNDDDFGRRRRD